MRARRHEEGFTLIELMVVVTIISVVAALAAPAIAAGLRERSKNLAALDVVRVFRGSRALSVGSGAAVLVRYDAASNGTLAAYQGDTNRCNSSNWVTRATGCTTANTFCRFSYAGSTFDHGAATNPIALTLQNVGGTTVDFCFESNGVTYWRVGITGRMSSNAISGGSTVAGGFQFNVSTGTGVDRNVVLPLGSDARLRR